MIPAVKGRHPEFRFIAEAYWELEWELQQQGFDFCDDLFRNGKWSLCDRSGWPDNQSCQNILAWCWVKNNERALARLPDYVMIVMQFAEV